MSNLQKIQIEFKEIIKTIDSNFGNGYSVKNPGLVQHLMDKIQQEEDREITRAIHNVS